MEWGSAAALQPDVLEPARDDRSIEKAAFRAEVPMVVLLVIGYIVLGHRHAASAAPQLHESVPVLVAGALAGYVLSSFGWRTSFHEEDFFYFVLPPIIFHQGYVKRGLLLLPLLLR